MLKLIFKQLAIRRVKHLQWSYKGLTEYALRGNQSNRVLSKLKFIQHELYYWKSQFYAWGIFHPSCAWSEEDQKYFDKLFPEIKFKEVDIVVWHNPAAVTYYHNKIYTLNKKKSPSFETEIPQQLKKWNLHR